MNVGVGAGDPDGERRRIDAPARSLFDPPDDRADAIARVKREVNDRFGRFTLPWCARC